ncbi:hypothetical protein QBC37DRAFT_457857 [Rhypophila decipiens]|uniref:F-box domain-containing protein n=1 Tax=Rhypophila decipiens TaxID=261697 RepID=A0AAN6YDA3_9PEZI|nr:hypothetical protein QBC37DRAFT_457857 [Rhypophila decipiens]
MPITDLPPELMRQCLSHLDPNDLQNTNLVCHLYPYRLGNIPKDLNTLLGGNSHIPRRLCRLVIDGQHKEWIEGLSKILGHFTRIRSLTIGYFDLTQLPQDKRTHLLNDIFVTEKLAILHLKVAEFSDITSFIFDNPQLKFLQLGWTQVKPKDGEKLEDFEQDGENRVEKDVAAASDDKHLFEDNVVVKLPKLKHLVSSTASPVVWSKILPIFKLSIVKGLKTLITECFNAKVVSELDQLVEIAGPSLRSLAIGMYKEGCRFDLTKTKSLVSLSLDLREYPYKEALLSDLYYTLTHVTNPKRIFINSASGRHDHPNFQHESGPPLWEALDAHLVEMEGLEQVTFTHLVVLPRAGKGPIFPRYSSQLLRAAYTLLPKCKAKGILTIEQIPEPWTSSAFADADMPEESVWRCKLVNDAGKTCRAFPTQANVLSRREARKDKARPKTLFNAARSLCRR